MCLANLFYVATAVIFSQDTHVGARIMGCTALLGPAWIALVATGALVRPEPCPHALNPPRIRCHSAWIVLAAIGDLVRARAP